MIAMYVCIQSLFGFMVATVTAMTYLCVANCLLFGTTLNFTIMCRELNLEVTQH